MHSYCLNVTLSSWILNMEVFSLTFFPPLSWEWVHGRSGCTAGVECLQHSIIVSFSQEQKPRGKNTKILLQALFSILYACHSIIDAKLNTLSCNPVCLGLQTYIHLGLGSLFSLNIKTWGNSGIRFQVKGYFGPVSSSNRHNYNRRAPIPATAP